MGFSAMKLINEAGMRGTAVISVAQPSAPSLVSSSDEAMGPFNTAAFPGGPRGHAGCGLGLFPGRSSPSEPRFISRNIPGEKNKKGEGRGRKAPPPLFIGTDSVINFFTVAVGQGRVRTKAGRLGGSVLSSRGSGVPGGPHPRLESIFSPNRFYSSFKVICQIIFPIYIVNESNPTNSF